ncbi:MAG: ZIP family metal transporter [Bacteroidota bacterium]
MSYIILFSAIIIGVVTGEVLKKQKKIEGLFLTFSGAFLLAITIFHLLPNVYKKGGFDIGIFIMIGIFLQILLEYVSKGLEHAHHDNHKENLNHTFTVPMFLSISVHAFLEGAPVHNHGHFIEDISNPILLGIFLHKIPISSIIFISFRKSGYSKKFSVAMLALFGLMTPAGSYFVSKVPVLFQYSPQINAVVIGIFLHISTVILFESDHGHKFNAAKLIVVASATSIVYFLF